MRKRVILIGLSLLFLFVFILTFVIAEGDPVEDALNGTGYATEINRSGWNLTGRGIDFDLYLINETNSTNFTYTIEIAPEPINYFNGSDYVPINTTIISNGCNYDYCVRKGVYFADFRDDYNPSGMIRFYYNGSEVIYTPISLTYYNGSTEQIIANASTEVTGYSNGSTFEYPSIFGSGFDLSYTYMNSMLKEELILSNNSIFPQPNLMGEVYLNINFEFNTSDVVYVGQENESGSIVFSSLEEDTAVTNIGMLKGVNSEGNDSYFILKPAVFDSNESRQWISYTVSSLGSNNLVSIVTPYSWINDSTRIYPIIIDPTTSAEVGYRDYELRKWYHVSGATLFEYFPYPQLILSVGNSVFNGDRYYRSHVRWRISSYARQLLSTAQSWDGFTVGLYSLYTSNSNYDDLLITVIDEDYPTTLTPTTNRTIDNLFNKTRQTSANTNVWNIGWRFFDQTVGGHVMTILAGTQPYVPAILNNVLNNNEEFVVGLSGWYENSGTDSLIQYAGLGDTQGRRPTLGIVYTCNNRVGLCDLCLNQELGFSCECSGECNSISGTRYCKGSTVNTLVCSSSCATNGQYASESSSCCSGLSWSSTTKQCSSAPSCPIPDGSGPNCDCDNDNECPSGMYCHQRAGYDSCELRQFCNGSIQVRTVNSQQQPLNGIKVYFDTTLQGTTNSGGYRDLIVNNVSCGASNNIEAKCSDNTLCGSGNVAIDYSGENDSIQFDCSICRTDEDLFISQGDVTINYTEISSSTSNTIAYVDVHSQNKNENGLNVRFNLIGKDGLVKDTKTNTINIASNAISSTNASLSSNEPVIYVTIQVDPDNEISNDSKTNNYVRRVVFGRTRGYLDINTGFSEVNSKIREFIESFVEPTSLSNSQIIYSVGRLSNYSQHLVNQERGGCMIRSDQVWVDGAQLDNPYTGAICSFRNGTKTVVVAIGSDIDGDIAAVKKLGSAANVYFSGTAVKPRIVIDWNDLTAIGVYDFLHNSENLPNYHVNTPQFGNITEKILNGNTYDVAIRLVNTTNANPTTLRIKNVNSDFSPNYRNTVAVNNPRPVVLSGGLFNNLEMWEGEYTGNNFNNKGLAKQLAETGRDTWEIEVTGGPIADNLSAPNYNYDTLVDNYWTASLTAIQYYTGKITLDFVGFSNGCRTALTGLERYQTTPISNVAWVQNLITGNFQLVDLQANSGANLVHTFVGVACPGAFEGESYLIEQVNQHPNSVAQLQAQGNLHPNRDNITRELVFLGDLFVSAGNRISLNIWDHYNDAILLSNDSQPGNFNVNKSKIFYGYGGLFSPWGNEQDDGLVTVIDNEAIADNINSSNLDDRASYRSSHRLITDKTQIKRDILEFLANG